LKLRRTSTDIVTVMFVSGCSLLAWDAGSSPASGAHKTAAIAGDSALGASPDRTLLTAGGTITVPLSLSMGQPVIDVFLNGKGPFRMFLDTGAGTTVLDQSLAKELGLRPRAQTRLGDPANPQAILADVVVIDTLRIGGAVFRGVRAASFDRSAIRPGEGMPRGVVGFPVFHELLETLDFPAATLRLTRGHLGAPDGRTIIHYKAPDGIPLVPIDVAGEAMEAHLDTGSPGFLSIPVKDSSRVRFAEPLREVGRGRTVNSFVTFRGATLDGAVRVSGATFDRPVVMLNDKLPNANLGSRALSDCVLTLDASNERLSIVRTRMSPTDTARHVVSGPPGAAPSTSTRQVMAGPAAGEKTAGVMLSPQPDGRLAVVGTLPGSAASRADIQSGDVVLELNGDPVATLGHDENRARLHHSPVTITLKRGDRVFDVTLEF
jgi:predicted aspartyl protease